VAGNRQGTGREREKEQGEGGKKERKTRYVLL